MIEIRVNGIPAPQGSKKHVGGGRMVESSKAVGPWREAVRAEAQRAVDGGAAPILDGPIEVTMVFYLPRPKGHFGKRGLLPSAPALPCRKPDGDKLARAAADGLGAGGVWRDDAQVTDWVVRKRFADEHTPGAVFVIAVAP